MVHPYTLPMLCKPNLWSDESFGGYLDNRSKEVSIITGASHHDHKIENKNSLFKAINYLNSIKFGINNLVLDYLNNEGKYLLDSIKPKNKLQREITLKIGQLFSKVPFYLNVHADWRGRIYTQSFFITYQGGDLSSALLNFWEGKSLTETGKYHLYIHGANNHNENNISKDSFENRVQWVENNYEKIINLDKSLILSAEKPFIFLAFCLNMRELHKNPKAIINTPVFLDATCSGIQHLSALLLDLELGISVNLSPYNQEEKPNDIYSELLIYINKAINKFGQQNPKYASLSLLKLTRGDIKTSVMTKVYNVSKYGISKQLESRFKSNNNYSDSELEKISLDLIKSLQKNKLNKNKKENDYFFRAPGKNNRAVILNQTDIFKIANIINEQIFVVYPSLNNIYSYFLEMAKIMIKLGTPITWITPAGMKITQNYLKSKQSVIATKLFNVTKKMVIKEYLKETDNLKQSNAIIPNIIHSLDATHLINLINNSGDQGFDSIITVHDCFGTHPNNMEKLVYRVKKEFILLYSQENFLQTFHNRLIQSIKDNNFNIILNEEDQRDYVIFNEEMIKIPNVPKLGELDLQKIIESKYMIT
jgi:DNA-directed RNA polymerase